LEIFHHDKGVQAWYLYNNLYYLFNIDYVSALKTALLTLANKIGDSFDANSLQQFLHQQQLQETISAAVLAKFNLEVKIASTIEEIIKLRQYVVEGKVLVLFWMSSSLWNIISANNFLDCNFAKVFV
jgi:hypothetical protein